MTQPNMPLVQPDVMVHWDGLVDQWINDASMPLPVRRRGGSARGSVYHHRSGRPLLETDNALANYCLSSALRGDKPLLCDIKTGLASGDIPVAMIFTRSEKEHAVYHGRQKAKMNPPNLNTEGWKVSHREPVGLGTREPITEVDLELVKQQARRFLSPRNMYLEPLGR